MKLGIIGFPVEHSISPSLHQPWLDTYAPGGTYGRFPLRPDEDIRTQVLDQLARLDGANLTIPAKRAVLNDLNLDDLAKRTGAVNTIFRMDGQLCGTNTDVVGFDAELSSLDVSTSGHHLILGAGGAARACAVALADRGATSIDFGVRDPERIRDFSSLRLPPHRWTSFNQVRLDRYVSITNTLPQLGYAHLDALNWSSLNPNAVFIDLNYWRDPPYRAVEFARRHRSSGRGMVMLREQARAAFQHWTGCIPTIP